ncbi:MAG: methyl-accepting chemotaxis protein, partial [Oscillospiraceae bacterium]|nr:methyl-accepting chemotaxis protein [Oscillospiraceae bacterium]
MQNTKKSSSLRGKITFSTGAIIIAMITTLSLLFLFELRAVNKMVVETTEEGFDDNIRVAVQTVIGALNVNHQMFLDGEITEDEAIDAAKSIVRDTRYSSTGDVANKNDGYFWADMSDGLCIVHYNPANEGAMRINAQDKEGTYFIQKFIQLGDAGGGFSEFYFGKPGAEDGSFKKRGYTEKFEPYGWYISTGNYYEDIDLVIDGVAAKERTMYVLIIVSSILMAIIVMVVIAQILGSLVIKPLAPLNKFMRQAGTTGDITLHPEDVNAIRRVAARNDEIGATLESALIFVEHINSVAQELEKVSKGDLSMKIEKVSPNDIMGGSLQHMVENLREMFSEINASTSQVSTGSKQIADGAQALAQGSTEQASSVEQLSSSITDIAQKTKDNADMAGRAAMLANTIKGNAEKGSRQMDEMMAAVKDINAASQ